LNQKLFLLSVYLMKAAEWRFKWFFKSKSQLWWK